MIDLRSDTVTQPSAPMRAAMMAADLGDDVLGDDPTVQALEEEIAKRLGKEAGLFTPSGTMANQLAIRSICEPGDEIIAHQDSHIIHYETGAPAALSGCMISPQNSSDGMFGAEDVLASIRSKDVHNPISRMVIVENTHNRAGGTVWPLESFEALANCAHDNNLHVHIDGARLFNAAAASAYDVRGFTRFADSVSVCFSKALGAPVGSALTGSKELIDRARRFRKMFGGTMRQSGLLAGAALYALEHNVSRLVEDHQNARILAKELENIDGIKLDIAAEETPSNMVFFQLELENCDAQQFCQALGTHDVAMIPMAKQRVRAVTHLDVDQDGVLAAAKACAHIAAAVQAGSSPDTDTARTLES